MMIGPQREAVIANIQEAVLAGSFHEKVEVNDPRLSSQEKRALVARYWQRRDMSAYRLKNCAARALTEVITWSQNLRTTIVGMDNLPPAGQGAIITSNHFNPMDNTLIRYMLRQCGRGKLYIVSQESNLAMTGLVGFLMNYADIIPISSNRAYMKKDFPQALARVLQSQGYVLIYPEQEMWFNYRKPRPPKRGAYYYAASFGVPVISCFVEMQAQKAKITPQLHRVDYTLHVLPTIYPQSELSIRENSLWMMEKDYAQKRTAYEAAYGQPLDYTFHDEDIAGWVPQAVLEMLAAQ